MLAEARRAAEERGVIERLTLQQADSLAVPTLFAEPIFDVALCHNAVLSVSATVRLTTGSLKRHSEVRRAKSSFNTSTMPLRWYRLFATR